MSSVTGSQWLEIAAVSFCKVAATSMGASGRVAGRCDAGAQGAFVPLVGAEDAIQIGITADPSTCQMLARRMLLMGEQECPSPSETRDALGEIANMVAGMTKASRPDKNRDLALGLPVLYEGSVNTTDAMVLHAMQVEWEGAVVAVTVISSK